MRARTHTYTHLKQPAQVTLLQEAMAPLETASEPAVSVRHIQGLPFHFPLPVLDPSNQSQPEEKRQVRDTGRCAFSKGAGCL